MKVIRTIPIRKNIKAYNSLLSQNTSGIKSIVATYRNVPAANSNAIDFPTKRERYGPIIIPIGVMRENKINNIIASFLDNEDRFNNDERDIASVVLCTIIGNDIAANNVAGLAPIARPATKACNDNPTKAVMLLVV